MDDSPLKSGHLLEVDKLPAEATTGPLADRLARWILDNKNLDAGSIGGSGYDLSVGRYLKLDLQRDIDQATIAALEDMQTTYWDAAFDLPLLLARKLEEENGLSVDPRTQICITSGITPAIDTVLAAFLDPGDEVVSMDPDFVTSFGQVLARGGRLVTAPAFTERRGVRDTTRWQFDPTALEDSIGPRTKILLYTNPNNPMGYVYSADDLDQIAAIASRHNLLVIENQCYERLVYSTDFQTSLLFDSLATRPSVSGRVVTLQGVSKGYHLSGYRVGWAVSTPAIVQALNFAQMWGTFSMAPSVTQHGVSAAMTMPLRQKYTRAALEIYRQNVDYLCDALAEIDEVECARPAGGPFCFMDVSGTGRSDREVAALLYAEGVATTFGAPWGPVNGANHIRLALSNDPAYHREAVDALVRALRKIAIDKSAR
jgi:aspartate/methionine/tyrosine aminotransferase